MLWCLLGLPARAQSSQRVMRVWGLQRTPAPLTSAVHPAVNSAALRHPHQAPVKGLRGAAMVSQVSRIIVQLMLMLARCFFKQTGDGYCVSQTRASATGNGAQSGAGHTDRCSSSFDLHTHL